MHNKMKQPDFNSSPRIKLDSSKVLGNPADGRTVGGEKSGVIGKVHFDTSQIIGKTADGRTIGSAKRGDAPK